MSKKAISGKSKAWMEFEYLLSFGDVNPPDIFGDEDEKPAEDFDKKLLNNFRKWLSKINKGDLRHLNDDKETMLMVAIGDGKFTIAAELHHAGCGFGEKSEELYFKSLKDFGVAKSEFRRELEKIRESSSEEPSEEAAKVATSRPKCVTSEFVEPKKRIDPKKLSEKWCAAVGIVPAAAPAVIRDVSGGGMVLASRDGGAEK